MTVVNIDLLRHQALGLTAGNVLPEWQLDIHRIKTVISHNQVVGFNKVQSYHEKKYPLISDAVTNS